MTTPGSPPAPSASASSSAPPVLDLNLSAENMSFYAAEPILSPTAAAPNGKKASSASLPSPTILEVKLPSKDPSQLQQHPVSATSPLSPKAPPTPVIATKPSNVSSPVITPSQPTVALSIVESVSSISSPTSPLATLFNGAVNGQTVSTDMEDVTQTLHPVELEKTAASEEPAASSNMANAAAAATAIPNIITSNNTSNMQALEELARAQAEEIERLKNENQRLYSEYQDDVASFKDERERNHATYNDLLRQFGDLQSRLAKKDQEYDTMSRNYLEHVRMIRATDDDHSTIMDRLNQLKNNIEHAVRKAQGPRSANLNTAAAIEIFRDSGLLDSFPVKEDKLESYHLNLYMESVIMSTLVSHFFEKPLSCVFAHNKGFKEIYDWMFFRNNKLAVRWRQQLCVMILQDPTTKTRQEEEVNTAANALAELLSKVYQNSNEVTKMREICNKAFELAVAMTAMDNVISPVTVPLGTDFNEDEMGPSLKSKPDGKVALVIFPAFKDQVEAFHVRAKVWCN
ncbi:hypothetical protein BG004_001896 [Podila humilis]|nr:hypothetical protein BG004_001896 [Podila humilis]